jgi:uncharacterized membrane protein
MTESTNKSGKVFHVVLWSMFVVAFCWFNYITWTQLRANLIFYADAGVFDYLCSGPRHGLFLTHPQSWDLQANYFAMHFRPILLLIMPFYFLVDHAMTFLSFENLALVGAVVPLCYFARRVLQNDLLALGIGGLYLTNHFVRSIHLANHPEAMMFLGFFLLFYAFESKNIWLYLVGAIWVLSIKEEMGLYLCLFAFPFLFCKDRWKWRVVVGTFVLGVLMVGLSVLVMKWAGSGQIDMADLKPGHRYNELGATAIEKLLFPVYHPILTIERLFRPVLWMAFLTTGLLALLDWRRFWMVFAAPVLFTITSNPLVGNLWYYYSYPIIPFLFYSTVMGTACANSFLMKKGWSSNKVLIPFLGVCLFVGFFLKTRTDGYEHKPFTVESYHLACDEIISYIPDDVPVAIQYEIYAKVPNRKVKLPLRAENLKHAEYILFNFSPIGRPADLFGDEKKQERDKVVETVYSDEFETVVEAYGYMLRKRKTPAKE